MNLHKPDTLGELVPNGIEITIQYTQVCWNIWDAIFCVRFCGPLTEKLQQWRDRMGSPFGSPNACNIQIGHIPSFAFLFADRLFMFHISQLFIYLFGFHCCHLFRKGVSNLYSLLQPGGQALLTFPINRNFQKTFKAVSIKEPWAEHFKASSTSSTCINKL